MYYFVFKFLVLFLLAVISNILQKTHLYAPVLVKLRVLSYFSDTKFVSIHLFLNYYVVIVRVRFYAQLFWGHRIWIRVVSSFLQHLWVLSISPLECWWSWTLIFLLSNLRPVDWGHFATFWTTLKYLIMISNNGYSPSTLLHIIFLLYCFLSFI